MTSLPKVECQPIPRSEATTAEQVRTIAIAGNPNSGKSTLFNALTGLRQKVGNYPGVTVEKKTGRFRGSHGESLELLDLPGTYSLQTLSPDETIARDVLLGRRADTPQPDVIVCVLYSTNLERNLYLVAQLAELGLPLVIALNMADLAERNGLTINAEALSVRIGCPVVPCVASQRKGLVELRQAISGQIGGKLPRRAPLPSALEEAARRLGDALVREQNLDARFAFAEALLILTGCGDSREACLAPNTRPLLDQWHQSIDEVGGDLISAVVSARYTWIQGIVCEVLSARGTNGANLTDRLDHWLMHHIWGWVFFLGVMTLMFFTIFSVAELPMGWIEKGQDVLSNWLTSHIPAGDFQDLIVNGVVAGVGGVVVFLPQILLLFFFIGLLEDTGYMARAAVIVDRFMSAVGLHGKSFVPMLSSFACAIPGIMATRTIDNAKDRLVTILVAPLVSCSAHGCYQHMSRMA